MRGRSLDVESLGGYSVWIGEKREAEAQHLGPRLVVIRRVIRDADYACIQRFEFRNSITEFLAFKYSAGGIGLQIPPQDRPPAMPIIAADKISVLIYRRELWNGGTWFEHS